MIGRSVRFLLRSTQHGASYAALRNTSKYTGTFVLKRVTPPLLSDRTYPQGSFRPLRRRHKAYETIQRPATQPLPNIDLVLTQNVDGLGRPGDVVSVKVTRAHSELLAQDRAVYASPENLEKYQELATAATDEPEQSSRYSALTAGILSKFVLAVTMNLDEPWTIQPWHVRVAFRKAGYVVPESCMQLPEREISGPDVENLQGRDFIVTVTINNCEKVPVRCRIHHCATNPPDRLPYVDRHWLLPSQPVFEEDRQKLQEMPIPAGASPELAED